MASTNDKSESNQLLVKLCFWSCVKPASDVVFTFILTHQNMSTPTEFKRERDREKNNTSAASEAKRVYVGIH